MHGGTYRGEDAKFKALENARRKTLIMGEGTCQKSMGRNAQERQVNRPAIQGELVRERARK